MKEKQQQNREIPDWAKNPQNYTFRELSPDESGMIMVHAKTLEDVQKAVEEIQKRDVVFVNTLYAKKKQRALIEAYLSGYILGINGYMERIISYITCCSRSLETYTAFNEKGKKKEEAV